MERRDITQTIEQVENLRLTTRRALQSFWFPLVLFGAFTLAASVVYLYHDGEAAGVYWAVAGPVGGIATAVYYARRETSLGVARPATPYIVVAVGMMIAAFVLPASTSGDLAEVISYLAVAAGYLCFGWIERDWRIAVIAAGMAATALVTLAVAPGSAYVVAACVTGTIMVASGLWFRRTQAPTAQVSR